MNTQEDINRLRRKRNALWRDVVDAVALEFGISQQRDNGTRVELKAEEMHEAYEGDLHDNPLGKRKFAGSKVGRLFDELHEVDEQILDIEDDEIAANPEMHDVGLKL